MTVQTLEGFLLTRNWRDTPGGVELEFWFASAQGPLCALVRGERSVFFLRQAELARAQPLLDAVPGIECKPPPLRSFELQPVVAVYSRAYREARRLADALREQGLEPLEADINPADRYLMERFVAGRPCCRGGAAIRELSPAGEPRHP